MPNLNPRVATGFLSGLRQAAAKRVRFLTAELGKLGFIPQMGQELEFYLKNASGNYQKALIDNRALGEEIAGAVKSFDRLHIEPDGIQLEGVTKAGLPIETAETIEAFKEGLRQNAKRWGISVPEFRVREKVGRFQQNSGYHDNMSLLSLAGENQFYTPGSATTDLERHAIDSLIQTHAHAAPAFFIDADAFARTNSTARTRLWSLQDIHDLTAGVPNTAGHMYNKGMTFGNLTNISLGAVFKGRGKVASLTTHYSDIPAKLMGLGERMVFDSERTSWIGWTPPKHYRVESRLAGASADPYVLTATELSALYDAVKQNVRAYVPGQRINEAVEKLVESGEQRYVVNIHPGRFDSVPLATSATEGHVRLMQSPQMREMLEEDLYHHLAVASKPEASELAKLPAKQQAELAEKMRESEAYVAAHPHVGEVETSEITSNMHEVMSQMRSPLRPESSEASWEQRMRGEVRGREIQA